MPGICFGQNFEYTGNFPIDKSRNISDIFEMTKLWFTNSTPGVVKTLYEINSDSGSLVGRFAIIFHPDCRAPKCIRAIGKVNFNVLISISKNSCNYQFLDFFHSGAERAPGGPISFGKITNDIFCPCFDIDGGKSWKNEQWSALKSIINAKVNGLIIDLKLMIASK